jgi:DNA repair exonuclease SbcCD nuclease subunit
MKVCIIGDLHYGEKSNSDKYNQQLNAMLGWVVEQSKARGVDKCVQLGDWYHHRNSINVQTITAGIDGAKILSKHFGRTNVFVLVGNHDIYFKDTIAVNSLAIIKPFITENFDTIGMQNSSRLFK